MRKTTIIATSLLLLFVSCARKNIHSEEISSARVIEAAKKNLYSSEFYKERITLLNYHKEEAYKWITLKKQNSWIVHCFPIFDDGFKVNEHLTGAVFEDVTGKLLHFFSYQVILDRDLNLQSVGLKIFLHVPRLNSEQYDRIERGVLRRIENGDLNDLPPYKLLNYETSGMYVVDIYDMELNPDVWAVKMDSDELCIGGNECFFYIYIDKVKYTLLYMSQ